MRPDARVVARTVYTQGLLVKLARLNAVRPKGKLFFYAVLELAMLAIVAYSLNSAAATGEAFALAAAFASVLPLVVPLMLLFLPLLLAKSNKGMVGAVNTYWFAEGGMRVFSKMPSGARSKASLGYGSLSSTRESKGVSYLYT